MAPPWSGHLAEASVSCCFVLKFIVDTLSTTEATKTKKKKKKTVAVFVRIELTE